MKRRRCPIEDARNTFAYEYAKAMDVELKEGHAFMDWIIAKGRRLEKRGDMPMAASAAFHWRHHT